MTITIDGSNSASATSTTVSAALTTTLINDLICVAVEVKASAATTITVTAPGLTFTFRTSKFNPGFARTEFWTAPSSGTLTGVSITVTASGSCNMVLGVFGVNGLTSIASPFDPNVSLPAGNGNSTPQQFTSTINTTNSNDIILSISGCSGSNTMVTPGGYTNILARQNGVQNSLNVSYILKATPQTSFGVLSSTNATEFIADALSGLIQVAQTVLLVVG